MKNELTKFSNDNGIIVEQTSDGVIFNKQDYNRSELQRYLIQQNHDGQLPSITELELSDTLIKVSLDYEI